MAARRNELGISQRELARRKVITAAALIAFEKGRAWPRERTRHTLEELLQWPAGTIARIRAGAEVGEPPTPGGDGADASVVADAVELALARVDDAIEELPPPADAAWPRRIAIVLADLRRLEGITARAVRHSGGSTPVVKALGVVRSRYDELMRRAASAPGATLGQRLYAARRAANLTLADIAAALGMTTEFVEAVEADQALDPATAHRIEALIDELG